MAASSVYLDFSTIEKPMHQVAPTFYLFGEPHRSVEESFVHAESLDDRSRPNEWTIVPHAHGELAHIFYLSKGGGIIRADTQRMRCKAPCLLLMPAGVIHGFEWMEETAGFVITLATRRLSSISYLSQEAVSLLAHPQVMPISGDDAGRVTAHITDLMRELSWSRIGHDAAVQASLLAILVIALRQNVRASAPTSNESRHRLTVARLCERIEERFRLREPVADYASALGTSETALRVACLRISGLSPGAMLNQRTLLEAKRLLLFSDISIGEIAYSLGFDDAAYFSRFFSQRACQSPKAYRLEQRALV